MSRADDFLALVDDPGALPPLLGDHSADELLMDLLVHLACSDGLVQDEEFSFLRAVYPDRSDADILLWVADTASKPVDLEGLSQTLGQDREQALGALRFAARLAWADRVLDTGEKAMLAALTEALNLSGDDLETALDEVVGTPSGDEVPPEKVAEAFRGMAWRAVSPEDAALYTDLAEVVPEGAVPVARLLVDGMEQVGLYDLGLAAKFIEGPRFVRWADVALYTRVPVLGATLRVLTMSGQTLTVADPRLQEVGSLLDRVYASEGQE